MTIEINTKDVFDVEIKPPRRRFTDFLPVGWRQALRKEPTPYELWLVKSVLLRGIARGLYAAHKAEERVNTAPTDKGLLN